MSALPRVLWIRRDTFFLACELHAALNALSTRQAVIRRRAKRRVSLRIAVPINGNSRRESHHLISPSSTSAFVRV